VQFSVSDNLGDIRKQFGRFTLRMRQNQKPAMLAAILQARTIIAERTAKGVDVNGAPFKPYTATYAAFRSRQGRTVTPNLMFTGRMLASMKVTADSRKGVLFFSRSEEARKAAFNNRTRRFFDLSKNELKRIQNVYFRRLTRER
jgi:hypothetical protein